MVHVFRQETFAEQAQGHYLLVIIADDGCLAQSDSRMIILGEIISLLLIARSAFAYGRKADYRIDTQTVKLLAIGGAMEIKVSLSLRTNDSGSP